MHVCMYACMWALGRCFKPTPSIMRVLFYCVACEVEYWSISAVWILNLQFVIQATPCTNKWITLNSGWVYALSMSLLRFPTGLLMHLRDPLIVWVNPLIPDSTMCSLQCWWIHRFQNPTTRLNNKLSMFMACTLVIRGHHGFSGGVGFIFNAPCAYRPIWSLAWPAICCPTQICF
jgi:hypothetical protein